MTHPITPGLPSSRSEVSKPLPDEKAKIKFPEAVKTQEVKTREVVVKLKIGDVDSDFILQKSSLLDRVKKFFGFNVKMSQQETALDQRLQALSEKMKTDLNKLYDREFPSDKFKAKIEERNAEIKVAKDTLSKTRMKIASKGFKEIKRMHQLFETKIERDSIHEDSTPFEKNEAFRKLEASIKGKIIELGLIQSGIGAFDRGTIKQLSDGLNRDIKDLKLLESKLTEKSDFNSKLKGKIQKLANSSEQLLDAYRKELRIPQTRDDLFMQVHRDEDDDLPYESHSHPLPLGHHDELSHHADPMDSLTLYEETVKIPLPTFINKEGQIVYLQHLLGQVRELKTIEQTDSNPDVAERAKYLRGQLLNQLTAAISQDSLEALVIEYKSGVENNSPETKILANEITTLLQIRHALTEISTPNFKDRTGVSVELKKLNDEYHNLSELISTMPDVEFKQGAIDLQRAVSERMFSLLKPYREIADSLTSGQLSDDDAVSSLRILAEISPIVANLISGSTSIIHLKNTPNIILSEFLTQATSLQEDLKNKAQEIIPHVFDFANKPVPGFKDRAEKLAWMKAASEMCVSLKAFTEIVPKEDMNKKATAVREELLQKMTGVANGISSKKHKAEKLVALAQVLTAIGVHDRSTHPLKERILKILNKLSYEKIESLVPEADKWIQTKKYIESHPEAAFQTKFVALENGFKSELERDSFPTTYQYLREYLTGVHTDFVDREINGKHYALSKQFLKDFLRSGNRISGSTEDISLNQLAALFDGVEKGSQIFTHLSTILHQAYLIEPIKDVSAFCTNVGMLSSGHPNQEFLMSLPNNYQLEVIAGGPQESDKVQSVVTWKLDRENGTVVMEVSTFVRLNLMSGVDLMPSLFLPLKRILTIPLEDLRAIESVKKGEVLCPNMSSVDHYYPVVDSVQAAATAVGMNGIT